MKKYKLIILILLIYTLSSKAYCEDLGLSAESYILIDASTGRVLCERNSHKKMPMASTTKIMTALIALEYGNLEDKVIVEKESVGIEGSSIYLREGEDITLKDMLYGLMLRSGNDSSIAISRHIGKSTENFVLLMNKKAKSIGALNTNFTNPHGLHDDLHYTTAYDLALITKEAFKYSDFKNIVKSKSYLANREENNYFYNKNKTLWEYKGGDGVKIGYTMRAGRCLVSSASRNNMQLIAVSLNARDWFNDNYKLLDFGFNNYKPYLIYDKGQFIKKINVTDGNKNFVDLITDESLFYPLVEVERQRVKISVEASDIIRAPIEKGSKIGCIYTYIDGQLVNKNYLVAKSSIKKANMFEKILTKMKFH